MKLMRKYLTRFLLSLIVLLLPIIRSSESQERIESFNARGREIAVKPETVWSMASAEKMLESASCSDSIQKRERWLRAAATGWW